MKKPAAMRHFACCGWPINGTGHNGSCTFYGLDEIPMSTEKNAVATKADVDPNLPAYLQGQQGKTSKLGNVDSSDIIIPRVKLLQSTSPEVEAYDKAKVGKFWHTLAEENLGDTLNIVPIFMKKEVVVWAPRGDDRGILARSSDCVNWDAGFENLDFEVRLKNVKEPFKFNTKDNVAQSKLLEFGQVNGDPDSKPYAALTYRFMFLFPDFLELGPAIIINTRSAIKPAKALISKIELRPHDHYAQQYVMGTTDETSDDGPYKGYKYTADGFPPEAAYNKAKELYALYKDVEWKTNDVDDEGSAGAGNVGGGKAESDKF